MQTEIPFEEIQAASEALTAASRAQTAVLREVQTAAARLEERWSGAAPEAFHSQTRAWLAHGAGLARALNELAAELQTLAACYARADE